MRRRFVAATAFGSVWRTACTISAGRVVEPVGLDDDRDEPGLPSGVSVEDLAGEEVPARRSWRHPPLAEHCDEGRRDADADLAERERRAGRRDHDVGRGDEPEATGVARARSPGRSRSSGKLHNVLRISTKGTALAPADVAPERSAPEQKVVPVAVETTARTSLSSRALRRASSSSARSCCDNALRLSGESSVMVVMWSTASTRTSEVTSR